MAKLLQKPMLRACGIALCHALLCACDAPRDETSDPKAVATLPARDAGWPAIHGPAQNSTSGEVRLNWTWPKDGPSVLWRTVIGKGYAVPVIDDGRLIAFHRIGSQEIIDCLDPSTGTRRWRFESGTNYESEFEYSDGPYSTPTLTDDAVYTLSAEGVLRRNELQTGGEVWSRPLGQELQAEENSFAVGTSPLVEGDRIFVNIGGTIGESGIVALDALTGETVWTATDHGDSYATPRLATIEGERHLFVLTDKALVALDPAQGRIRWQAPFSVKGGPERVTAVSPLVIDDLVLLVGGPGPGALMLRVLPGDRYEEVWRDRRALDSQFNNLVSDGRHVFGFTSVWNGQAEFRCLDPATGEVLWGWESVLRRGSSLFADGKLLLLGENGHLAVLEAAGDEPQVSYLSEKPLLAGPTFTAPALSDGRLYLRNEKELLCLDLRPSRSVAIAARKD